MIPSLFKMMALTGSAVIGGGTIVNQVFFSEGKESKIKSRDISGNSLTTSELGCVIYEAKEPSGSWGRHKFTQLEKKFKSMEEFLKETIKFMEKLESMLEIWTMVKIELMMLK
ncbi:hypothetical protein HF1_10170 [Mycoplasma haemofelis str. Langford 1]|uniref:Uncharacterized protein n=1 Tax=Mycoplasma haemofelis (strain Langford 1) TaxID=941640 RepID=E8ZIQ4_MYCHL|nr:hypothetical protein [Mycoplasma haemofelis]CBY93025.1 hypothetical protein HF1_10170 [Mycoplasma haemofelis str. Langford 1]